MKKAYVIRAIVAFGLIAFLAGTAVSFEGQGANTLVQPDKTPKKNKAVFYAPHASGAKHEAQVKKYVEAENYSFTSYKPGATTAPTVTAFKQVVEAKDYAVLVIATHGNPGGLTIEEFPTPKARNDALAEYKKDKDLGASFGSHLHAADAPEISANERRTLYTIEIDAAGLRQIFGTTDANRTILFVAACQSYKLQTESGPPVFPNTEFLGYPIDTKYREVATNLDAFFGYMGGDDGISKRSVVGAWSVPLVYTNLKHEGPGNTTLAPAVEVVLMSQLPMPLNADMTAIVRFDTEMDASKTDVVTIDGCGATVENPRWENVHDGTSTEYWFDFKATKPERLIVKVEPTKAVSKNNSNRLVGNLYKPNEDTTDPNTPRKEVNEPPFGDSGLDGLKHYPPPDNPYRERFWCGPEPESPSIDPRENAPEQSLDDPILPFNVAVSETLAFILFHGDAEEDTEIMATDVPPNFSCTQIDNWYAHVIFTPDSSQLGETYEVTFESASEGGPYVGQTVPFTVAERRVSVAIRDMFGAPLEGDLGEIEMSPDDEAELAFLLLNSGNTRLRDITLTSAVDGMTASTTPTSIDLLNPGDNQEVQITVESSPAQTGGVYPGSLVLGASTETDTFVTEFTFSVFVNSCPTLDVAVGSIDVCMGDSVSVPVSCADLDGNLVDCRFELGPAGACVCSSDGSEDLAFEWEPGPKDTGERAILLIADDGYCQAAQELLVQVEGPVNVNAVPGTEVCEPDRPLPIDVWYVNRNDGPATVFETIEVFDTILDGLVVYAGAEMAIGVLGPGEELGRSLEIPALGTQYAELAVRVTARTVINGATYYDESDFMVGGPVIPTISEWGLVILVLLLLSTAKVCFGRRWATFGE